jgi:hypothetical protein
VSVFEALAAAKAAGVELSFDGRDIVAAAPKLPADVVELLRAVKPELMRIFAARETARAALYAEPPSDCREDRWTEAMCGLHRFIVEGWGDRAALIGCGSDWRDPTHWTKPSDCHDGGVDRDRDAIGLAAQVSSDWAGACGVMSILSKLYVHFHPPPPPKKARGRTHRSRPLDERRSKKCYAPQPRERHFSPRKARPVVRANWKTELMTLAVM